MGPECVCIVEGSCGYRAHGVSIRGKFVLLRNLGYKTTGEGGRQVANRSSNPRIAYPEVKVQVRDLVRVVGTVGSGLAGRYSWILSTNLGYKARVVAK